MTFWRSFRFQLTLQCALALACLLALFTVGVYVGLSKVLYHNLDTALWFVAESEMASASDAPGGAIHFHEASRNPLQARELVRLDKFVQFRAFPQGRILGKSPNLGKTQLPLSEAARAQLTRGDVLFETVSTSSSPPIRLLSLPILRDGHVERVMQIGASLAPLYKILNGLQWVLLIMDGSALLLITLMGVFLAHRALQPINRLVRAIEQIASQNLDQRLPITPSVDEIGRLTRVINHMLERLEHSFYTQRRFIANASHELRSPLANLRMALELALRRPRTPEDYRQSLRSSLEETEQLSDLVNDLLTLSRADSGHFDVQCQSIALIPFLQPILDTYKVQAETKHITMTLSSPDIRVNGDRMRLQQLFSNLLDNALRYTSEGGMIQVTGICQDDSVQISITDTGIGIPPEHLPHIFERFYRVDKGRAREAGGSGLGLAICREIARAHGGSLIATSAVGHGSTFALTLPHPVQK